MNLHTFSSLLQRAVRPVYAKSLMLAANATALSMALAFQYLGGLLPCILCLYQRAPMMLTMIMIGIMFVWSQRWSVQQIGWGIIALLQFINTGIAFYHSGVERHWWTNVLECTTQAELDSIDAITRMMQQPNVPCDVIPWSVVGLSMANLNVPFSLALCLFAAMMLVVVRRSPHAESKRRQK